MKNPTFAIILVASFVLSACTLMPRGPADPDEAAAYYGIHLYAEKDFDGAFKKVKPWADKGHATGLILIGGMYYDGKGTTQDDIAAYMYVTLGLDRSQGEVRERALKFREEIAGGMTAGEIIEAQRQIRRWRPMPTLPAGSLLESEDPAAYPDALKDDPSPSAADGSEPI